MKAYSKPDLFYMQSDDLIVCIIMFNVNISFLSHLAFNCITASHTGNCALCSKRVCFCLIKINKGIWQDWSIGSEMQYFNSFFFCKKKINYCIHFLKWCAEFAQDIYLDSSSAQQIYTLAHLILHWQVKCTTHAEKTVESVFIPEAKLLQSCWLFEKHYLPMAVILID